MDLTQAGVEFEPLVDRTRPTTNKNAIVDAASGYRLLKLDTVDNRSISDHVAAEIGVRVGEEHSASVFSDFRHGIFNRPSKGALTVNGRWPRV